MSSESFLRSSDTLTVTVQHFPRLLKTLSAHRNEILPVSMHSAEMTFDRTVSRCNCCVSWKGCGSRSIREQHSAVPSRPLNCCHAHTYTEQFESQDSTVPLRGYRERAWHARGSSRPCLRRMVTIATAMQCSSFETNVIAPSSMQIAPPGCS